MAQDNPATLPSSSEPCAAQGAQFRNDSNLGIFAPVIGAPLFPSSQRGFVAQNAAMNSSCASTLELASSQEISSEKQFQSSSSSFLQTPNTPILADQRNVSSCSEGPFLSEIQGSSLPSTPRSYSFGAQDGKNIFTGQFIVPSIAPEVASFPHVHDSPPLFSHPPMLPASLSFQSQETQSDSETMLSRQLSGQMTRYRSVDGTTLHLEAIDNHFLRFVLFIFPNSNVFFVHA